MNESRPFQPKRILCPMDFSELSDLALKYAVLGAREFGAGADSVARPGEGSRLCVWESRQEP